MSKKRVLTGWIGKHEKITDINTTEDVNGILTDNKREWADSIGWPPRKVRITIEEL